MVRVPAYISAIISTATDEGPDDLTCFPAGLHYLLTFQTRMSKITQKSVCLYATFPRNDVLIYPVIYRYICELSQKGEFIDTVDPRGNIPPRHLSATEIVGNCLPVHVLF